ncbi:SIMPL domain-containing protein [Leptolyngbya sp. FACHB-261]|uniref:SIMPL domain-containing protein n=1 Tax=Leptolyngbya sp. FACHB-261 TaxID=2692806 RepID=UPI0016823238|nr:SIMPL domain-containing protein [Leptolyngbya sp. FACHB-261]MBD2104537.1 SIMPL domain-containing protein [Leptolyngbya sp. FACHB-261]
MSALLKPISSKTKLLGLPILLAMVSLNWLPPAPAFAADETPKQRIITVTGRGEEPVQTTKAEVQLGVQIQGQTAQEVQRQVAERSAAVVRFLQGQQVERLQTTGINLSPTYDYSNNRQRLVGYTGQNTVSFRVPVEKAGPLLDRAVSAGATRIDSVNFVAPEAGIREARATALREAVEDARAQANAVLATLGHTAQVVQTIQVDGGNVSPPVPYLMNRAELSQAADKAPTPVVGGQQQVQAAVTLQITY